MKLIYATLLVIGIFFSTLVENTREGWSAEFPTGTLRGISFSVEKGSRTFSEKDLYKFHSVAEVTKRPNGEISITMDVTLQLSPKTQVKKDKRFDTYQIIWKSEHNGQLINTNSKYGSDISYFSIVGNRLTVKSWIHRNQLWETQTYVFKKPAS